jgi:O-succinylbenzoic acid--CoA ligase
MSVVHLHQHPYSFDQIKLAGAALINDPLHNHSFTLIQQWLNGAKEFTFTTSGSTGKPKPIHLTRAQLMASAMGTIETLELNSSEHVLVCMNTQFIGGAMLLIRALVLNAEITLMEPGSHPLSLIATNHHFTLASFAPLQVYPLLSNQHHEQEKLNRFKNILVGGAPIHPSLETALANLDTRVFHTYGMTETVSHIALKQLGKENYYTVLSNVQIKTDAQHCLMICSAATNNQWIHTKDVVEMFPNKQFTILGRLDDVINSGGIKVWPQHIEYAIRQEAGNRFTNICVLGLPDEQLGQKVVALLEGDAEMDLEDLKNRLAKHLTRYQIPKQFFTLQAFSYTPTGKTDKTKTLEMLYL